MRPRKIQPDTSGKNRDHEIGNEGEHCKHPDPDLVLHLLGGCTLATRRWRYMCQNQARNPTLFRMLRNCEHPTLGHAPAYRIV